MPNAKCLKGILADKYGLSEVIPSALTSQFSSNSSYPAAPQENLHSHRVTLNQTSRHKAAFSFPFCPPLLKQQAWLYCCPRVTACCLEALPFIYAINICCLLCDSFLLGADDAEQVKQSLGPPDSFIPIGDRRVKVKTNCNMSSSNGKCHI